MEAVYYDIVGFCCLIALGNWRVGIFAIILIDVVRDPVRKLVPDHPVMITLAASAVWAAIFVGVYQKHHAQLRLGVRVYPRMRRVVLFLLAAILPAAAWAVVLYDTGWKLALIGTVSYGAPFLGLAIGFVLPDSEQRVYRIMAFYVAVNALALIGTPAEYYKWDWPALGGIDMIWIRYHGSRTVNLIAGFYRSPDIMGLHAAHVVVFSVMLAMRPRSQFRAGWAGVGAWGMFCLLLAGRRKMIAIPLVFMACYLLFSMLRGLRGANVYARAAFIVCLVGAAVFFQIREEEVSGAHVDYAGSLLTEGATRSQQIVLGSVRSTLEQSGLLGSGLGSATQGSYHAVGRENKTGWQEDGVSRLFKEFGVPGAIMMVAAAIMFAIIVWQAVCLVQPHDSLQLMQIALLSVGLANIASFAASHQQYSGDPVTSIFVAVWFGTVLGTPLLAKPSDEPVRLTRGAGRRLR